MTHHLHVFLRIVLAALLGFPLVLGGGLAAVALTATGFGVGYMHTDGRSWIGSYRMADGTLAFCLEAGKATPVGSDFNLIDGRSLGRYDSRESAILAYLSREWAPSEDALTAAAAQLATWTIGGLNGKEPSYYAGRAGADAARVLERATAMLSIAEQEASTGISSKVSISLPEAGDPSFRADLTAERVDAARDNLPAGIHSGTAVLTGAVFDDGSTSREIPSGIDVAIHPNGDGATVEVGVDVTFDGLPYGSEITVAVPSNDVQSLLTAQTSSARSSAMADRTGVSPRPFRPTIDTLTSVQTGGPGTHISDLLTVAVAQVPEGLDVWGVSESDGVYQPIGVVIESSLLGPFDDRPGESAVAPADAPAVCVVETVVDGVGEYRTPDCELNDPGWYTWVERIVPERTPEDEGGARVVPWESRFGIPTETTRIVREQPRPELARTGGVSLLAPAVLGGAIATAGAVLVTASRLRRCRH